MSQTCPHCMTEIADNATTCPGCHAKYRTTFSMNSTISKIFGFSAIITTLFIVMLFSDNREHQIKDYVEVLVFILITIGLFTIGNKKKWWN